MALTNFKNEKPSFDDEKKLMCTFPGCQKRWAVMVNGQPPKCSEHQWIGTKKPSKKTIDAWYNREES